MLTFLGCGQPVSGYKPKLDIDFVTLSNLFSKEGVTLTHSRTSGAMFYNSTGDLTYANENIMLYSEDFSNAAWVKTSVTVGTSTTSDVPIAGMTAWPIYETAVSDLHEIAQGGFEAATGNKYTVSVYAKGIGRNLRIVSNQGFFGTQEYSTFDLTNGTVFKQGTNSVPTITSIGNGWYRCAVTMTATAFGGNSYYFDTAIYGDTGRTTPHTGDVNLGLWLSGAMVSRSPNLQPYYKTISTVYSAPRFDYDPVSFTKKGLYYEIATQNMLLRSQDYGNSAWTKTDISGSGVTTEVVDIRGYSNSGSKIIEGTAGTGLLLSSTPTVTANSKNVCSHYIKRGNTDWICLQMFSSSNNGCNVWFNLNTGVKGTTSTVGTGSNINAGIITLKNGWYRIWSTCSTPETTIKTALCSASADASTTRVSSAYYYLAGSQLEAGIYPSSYVYTRANGQPRSADNLSITASSWYKQTEGSMICTYISEVVDTSTSQTVVGFSDGTNNNRIQLKAFVTSNNAKQFLVASGGTSYTILDSNYPTNTVIKLAASYKANALSVVSNGGNVTTTATATIPSTVNTFNLGGLNGSEGFRGWIQGFKYYDTKLSDNDLKTI